MPAPDIISERKERLTVFTGALNRRERRDCHESQAPRPDVNLSEEEKARIARRFRRGAILADAASVLFFGLVLALVLLWRFSVRLPDPLLFTLLAAIPLSMAGVLLGELLVFRRCPFCGRLLLRRDWAAGVFRWRIFHCPDCDFEPDWERRQGR